MTDIKKKLVVSLIRRFNRVPKTRRFFQLKRKNRNFQKLSLKITTLSQQFQLSVKFLKKKDMKKYIFSRSFSGFVYKSVTVSDQRII